MYSSILPRDRKRLVAWLSLCAVMVALMVVVGGLTRLTESGLSIVEWKPVTGIWPPMGRGQWESEFKKYQSSPQYRKINQGMSVEQFKGIFWLEYVHRLLGRLIGFVFLLPFLFFLRRIPRGLAWKLGGIFALGGAQGLVGWRMVKSGLVDQPWVSPVRLMLHLTIAFVILALLLWVIRQLLDGRTVRHAALRGRAGVLAGLIFIQVMLGALVAGNDAGLVDNTFPLMEGKWVPPGLLVMEPAYRNFIENAVTVQFVHRLMAYVIAVVVCLLMAGIYRRRGELPGQVVQRAGLVLAAFVLQFLLGVLTLIYHVPVLLASLHQANAVVLFALSLWLAFDFDSCSQRGKKQAGRGHGADKSL